MKSQIAASRARFAGFEIDLKTGDVVKGGRRFRVQAQPLKALRVLLENQGQLVTRDELRKEVWPDETFVDFDHGLNKAIAKLRDVLDEHGNEPSLIETLPKQGYRFLPPVDFGVRDEETPAKELEAKLVVSAPKSKHRKLLIATLVVLMIGAATYLFGRRLAYRKSSPMAVHAIAVLPLENLSGNPAQDYFADGMTDELITMLAQNSSLRVISRTSVMQYKGVHRPVGEIASRLGVEAILEGTVILAGDKVRVTTQLIYTPTDAHLWAESYERDVKDVFSLQREVAQSVAARVNAKFFPAEPSLKQVKAINPEAYDAYLRGRYYWFADRRLDKTKEFFTQAVTLQPDYAAPWTGLADVAIVKAVYGETDPKNARIEGEQLARKALELDDSLPEAHNSMAAIHLFFDWDWKAADQEAQRAIALNPNFAEAHHLRSYTMLSMNRFDESIQEAKKAIALDPGARPWGLGFAYILTGHYDEALNELKERSEAHPDDASLHYLIADAYKCKGMERETVTEIENGMRLSGKSADVQKVENDYATGGLRAIWMSQLKKTQEAAKKTYVSPLKFAEVFADLQDKEQTIHYLELAYRERAPQLQRVHVNPHFNFLHSDPRFVDLIAKVGLALP